MKLLRISMLVMPCLLLIPVVRAQEATEEKAAEAKSGEVSEAMAILNKMVEASKKVQSASYVFKAEGIGMGKNFIPEMEANCKVSGYKYEMAEKARLELKIKKNDSEEVRRVTAGVFDEEYYLIDHGTKTAYKDMDTAVYGSAGMQVQFSMASHLLEPDPFEELLKSKSQELKEGKTIDGHDCYAVYVVYGEGPRKGTFFISKKDHHLRGLNFIFKDDEEGKGGVDMTITDLKVDPKLSDDTFKFVLPEGYTMSDDFAS